MSANEILHQLAVLGIAAGAVDGFVELTGPCHRLTPELREAIRDGKPALLGLLGPNGEAVEREAINCSDDVDADEAVEAVLADWEGVPEPIDVCDKCGGQRFRWDIRGDRHCMRCEPGQSQRVMALAEKLRKRADKTLQAIHNEQDASGVAPRGASNRNLYQRKGNG